MTGTQFFQGISSSGLPRAVVAWPQGFTVEDERRRANNREEKGEYRVAGSLLYSGLGKGRVAGK